MRGFREPSTTSLSEAPLSASAGNPSKRKRSSGSRGHTRLSASLSNMVSRSRTRSRLLKPRKTLPMFCHITSLQFEAAGAVSTITSSVPVEQAAGLIGAYGSIEGRVETLTSRRGVGFALYDLFLDRAIRCHPEPDQANIVRDAWHRRVIVSGWVRRDPASGRPVKIDPVQSIELVPDVEPGSYRRARAVAPVSDGDEPSHVAIRRLRDA